MMSALTRRLLATTMIGGALVAGAPGFAQTTPAPAADEAAPADAGSDIVVTGSRIARPNLEMSSPVSVIDSAELSARSPVSVEQVLRQLPGTVAGINPGVNNGTNGVASVNLRNLGTNRNLVLLNGRRIVPSTIGSVVDTNVIPVALIDRSDVLTGGAVTTYGADAIAGVVNFVTKRDFAGVQADAQYGVAEQGDGQGYRLDLTTGANFDDGRGNAVLGFGYTKTRPVIQGDREIGLVSRGSTCTTAQLTAGVCNLPRGVQQGSNTAVPASLFFPLPTSAVDPTRSGGARFDPVSGTIAPGLTDYNFNPLNYYQTPLDRWNIFGSAHYEVAPNIEVYGEAFYVRSRVTQNLAPTGTFTEQFQVPLNNQFLTPAQRTQLCAYSNTQRADGSFPLGANCATAIANGTEIPAIVARRFVETGPRVAEITSNVFQVTAGVRGKLISNLSFDLFGQYGEAERTRVDTGNALRSRVQQALRGCPTGSSTGCTPINIFGAEGSLTPAMLAFVGVPTSQRTNTELGIVQGVISGDFGFGSPLADQPIGIAIGGEYRRYAGRQLGDLPNQQPGEILGAGGAFLTVDGEFSSKEVFGELSLPLVSDRPFFHELTVDAGIRYADYTTTGGNTTWKVGGSWAPVRDFNFRGAYTRAVRAPNIGELFLPTNTILNNLTSDPCQGNVTSATTRAICIAQLAAVGLPAATLGNIPAPIAGQINVTNPGTPDLDQERATTITAGVVLRPTSIEWLRGFAATVDWYRIRVRGAITTPTVGDILNGCFAQTSATDARCLLIRRNPLTGGLSGSPATTPGVTLLQSNQGFLENEGVDFTVSYSREFGAIRFNGSFNGNYTDKSRQQSNANSFIRECVGQYSVSCESPLPRWSWNYRATVGYDKVDLSGLWRHIGYLEYERRTGATPTTPPAAGTVGSFGSVASATVVPAYRNIPSYDYFDVNVGYNISEQFRLQFLVENLFNKKPPEVGNTIGSTSFNSGNTYPSLYDVVGRRFTVATRLRF